MRIELEASQQELETLADAEKHARRELGDRAYELHHDGEALHKWNRATPGEKFDMYIENMRRAIGELPGLRRYIEHGGVLTDLSAVQELNEVVGFYFTKDGLSFQGVPVNWTTPYHAMQPAGREDLVSRIIANPKADLLKRPDQFFDFILSRGFTGGSLSKRICGPRFRPSEYQSRRRFSN